ncbi:MAG: cupin domain-containing protein [Comamonadaceae bacterium]|nr:MAG: cupin domain-containing protein [Comamonadaceae bacterium]
MTRNDSAPPIRRIVTGHDAQRQSVFVEDGASPAQKTIPERPGYRVTNLWRTFPAGKVDAADCIAQHEGVLPPKGGTVFRIIEWPAEDQDPEALHKRLAQTFQAMYPDADHRPLSDRHPGMHETRTVDYALVLEGEIVAIMDEGEKVMRAGDVLIQRGTLHAWANRSGQPVKMAFILVDAS